MSDNKISKRIKEIRLQHKESQLEFSKKNKISRSTLSQIELGKSSISVDLLKTICLNYNVDIEWFIQGKEKSTIFNSDLYSMLKDKNTFLHFTFTYISESNNYTFKLEEVQILKEIDVFCDEWEFALIKNTGTLYYEEKAVNYIKLSDKLIQRNIDIITKYCKSIYNDYSFIIDEIITDKNQ